MGWCDVQVFAQICLAPCGPDVGQGRGRLRNYGCRFLHMEMLESLVSATGSMEVSLAFAVPKLLLSSAIWAALETSHGKLCYSLGGLLDVLLDI